jgi:DNA-binding response OmpR family regulator
MKENRILIVEDDLNILIGLEDNLKAEGYEVLTASSGDSGLQTALNEKVHLVLLDIMLPGMNGFEVCKKIRQTKPELPIIMVTARETEIDKIAGLDYGADDYITKPFSLSVLLARIRAVMRRAYPEQKEITDFTFGSIFIDFKAMRAEKDGTPIKFTRKEYAILKYFAEHEGEVVHRHDLLNQVWGYDKLPSTRTVDNFILEIRKKIEAEPSKPKHIVSISGVGYRFLKEAEGH